jgi:hypothetical protein
MDLSTIRCSTHSQWRNSNKNYTKPLLWDWQKPKPFDSIYYWWHCGETRTPMYCWQDYKWHKPCVGESEEMLQYQYWILLLFKKVIHWDTRFYRALPPRRGVTRAGGVWNHTEVAWTLQAGQGCYISGNTPRWWIHAQLNPHFSHSILEGESQWLGPRPIFLKPKRRGAGTCPRTHSKSIANLGLKDWFFLNIY